MGTLRGRPSPLVDEPGSPTSQLRAFVDFCERHTGERFASHASFHDFSVAQRDQFWRLFLEWSELRHEGTTEPVCTSEDCETAEFFPGLRLSYAENLLLSGSPEDDARGAIIAHSAYGEPARLTRGELRRRVHSLAMHLEQLGVHARDRVVAVAGNNAETAIAALASATLGAAFASAAPEMGVDALISRFGALQPKLLFANRFTSTTGGLRPLDEHIAAVVRGLPSVSAVVALDDGPEPQLGGMPVWRLTEVSNATCADPERWQPFAFNHPLFVLFTSGTTGPPKCLVHGAGGTLLEHVKEHRLHVDLRPGERLFFHTTVAWMMWNWQLSALASGAELVLYDGPVNRPDALWEVARSERVNVFGTSPPYLQMCQDARYVPSPLPHLRTILSTGSILHDWQFDWVAEQLGPVRLQSIAGGTDIIGCFVLGNPDLSVRRGLIQCRSLGLDVQALPSDPAQAGSATIGELVCRNPFPSRPLGFFGDDGRQFHAAYFEANPGVWTQGDLIEFDGDGQARMRGRSDGVLNVRGSRIGPAEIYRALHGVAELAESMAVELWGPDGESTIALLVVLHPPATLDQPLISRIRRDIATNASALHVPALVAQVDELPVTHSGKRSERAARDAINGRPVGNPGALANPHALERIKAAVAAAQARQRELELAADASAEEPTEARVLAIWEAILGMPVQPDDNFFELGGSSLTAVRLLAAIHERIGIELPPAVFIYAQTPAQIAALIDGPADVRAPILVPMRAGVGSPLFVVHALAGDVLHIRPLVLALNTDRPVYGLQAVGVDPRFGPQRTIEEMASTYVAVIRSVQPDGPYALTGYSMGGLVAFEIAQRLRGDGQQVDTLALLDTDLSPACLSRPARWWFAISRPFRYLSYAAAEPRARVPLFARKLLRRLFHWPPRSAPVSARRPLSRFAELEQVGLLAYECYRPRRYDGRAILFVATTRYPGFCDPASAWPRYVRELIVERIAGDHGSLVAEGTVAPLALRLSSWVRQGALPYRLRGNATCTSSTSSRTDRRGGV